MVLNLKNILGAAGTAALIRGPTVSTAYITLCPPTSINYRYFSMVNMVTVLVIGVWLTTWE